MRSCFEIIFYLTCLKHIETKASTRMLQMVVLIEDDTSFFSCYKPTLPNRKRFYNLGWYIISSILLIKQLNWGSTYFARSFVVVLVHILKRLATSCDCDNDQWIQMQYIFRCDSYQISRNMPVGNVLPHLFIFHTVFTS